MLPKKSMTAKLNARKLTIPAQDPAVRINGRLTLATVSVPYEELADGPMGCRVKAVDYDASADVLYQPLVVERGATGELIDSFARGSSACRTIPPFTLSFAFPNFACSIPGSSVRKQRVDHSIHVTTQAVALRTYRKELPKPIRQGFP
ncbi:MAG: hypothetical protein JWP34_3199 [Massilia sp.]|nr:hypothetical protein [Massilia sp.]